MKEVSHREFNRVKARFNPNAIYYYRSSAPMIRSSADDWVRIAWRFKDEKDDLFCIKAYGDTRPKEYYVSDFAYKILHIFELCDVKEPVLSCGDGISW